LAVACLSIAGKFTTSGNGITKLIQYRQAINKSLANENTSLDALEVIVMQTLNWKVPFITPSEISQCVIATLDNEHLTELENHTAKIINFTLTGKLCG